MSFVHEAQCDQCGKREAAGVELVYAFPVNSHERYPDSWLMLARAGQIYKPNEVVDWIGLCSWECVAAYGKKRAEPVW